MNEIPLILGVETATLGGSVCLSRGNDVLAARIGDAGISHSNSLLLDINECLSQAGISLQDVTLLACASGPGSFTGLRIGLATVKALAVTLGRPCIGIPTLKAIAHAAGPSGATVALLPAGRGELFVQLLSVGADGRTTEADQPSHLSPLKVLKRYGEQRNLVWTGPGAQIHADLIREHAQRNQINFSSRESETASEGWSLAPNETNLAQHIVAIALLESDQDHSPGPEQLQPMYVRPSDAELKEQCS